MANTKLPATSFRPDIPRRVIDIPGTARPRGADGLSDLPRESDRKLMIGREISLTGGEITACEHLIVEGRIEARLRDCRIIEVADSGSFKGSADIEDADIAGRFDGDLTVTGRLRVRSTALIQGTIRYGLLEVEAGGRLSGTLEPLETGIVTPLHDPALASHHE